MNLRIAVHLARRREQEARPLQLGEAEHVVCPVGAHLERVERQAQVVDRARRARQVEDEVDRLLETERLRQIVIQKEEVVGSDVLDVLE